MAFRDLLRSSPMGLAALAFAALGLALGLAAVLAWPQPGAGAESPVVRDAPPVPLAEPDWRTAVLLDDDDRPRIDYGQGFETAHAPVDVPEPLLFDLVRPLGARRGEVEVNVLAIFPWAATNTNLQNDPVGPGPTTLDRQGIEWAPEIEFALTDNFAVEFEFPFEGATFEAYKLGLQWTLGTAFDNRYIHGVQVLTQPTSAWRQWNTTLLYLGGIRFDETWSAGFMIGGRMDLEGGALHGTFETLFNAALFADLNDYARVGLETNYAAKVDGTAQIVLVPQLHHQISRTMQLQAGLGFGIFTEGSEQSFMLRAIYNQ